MEDNLMYWRSYGNNGRGCSLLIAQSAIEIGKVYKIRYRPRNFGGGYEEDEQVAKRLEELFEVVKDIVDRAPKKRQHDIGKIVAEGLYRVIYGYYHLIKDTAYKEEKEWRMIRIRPRSDEIWYDPVSENLVRRYVEGPALSELLRSASVITVGPALVNPEIARDCLENLIKSRFRYVTMKCSDINYTN